MLPGLFGRDLFLACFSCRNPFFLKVNLRRLSELHAHREKNARATPPWVKGGVLSRAHSLLYKLQLLLFVKLPDLLQKRIEAFDQWGV